LGRALAAQDKEQIFKAIFIPIATEVVINETSINTELVHSGQPQY
jgi:monomeric isocitrate dehydrogenase